jgi:hypothetical protein
MKTIQVDDELFEFVEWSAQMLGMSAETVIHKVLERGLLPVGKTQLLALLDLAQEQEYDTRALAKQVAERLEAEVAETHLLHAENLVSTPDIGLIDVQPVDPNGPDISGFGWMLGVYELREGKWKIRERR